MTTNDEKASCSDCGGEHRSLFSKEVIHLYQKIEECDDESKKEDLMGDIAHAFADSVSPLQYEMDEETFALLNELDDAHSELYRVTMRLARLVMRSVAIHLSFDGAIIPHAADGKSETPADGAKKAN